jgi:UDP-N-acetylglucosamine 2-epimerase
MHVCTIVGTRPEIIRLSRVVDRLDQVVRHTLVHTGQNYDYELNEIFFEDLGIRAPDHFLEAVGEHALETVGLVLARSYDLLRKIRPDAVLLLGDTNSALSAYAAKRLQIPVFHMEAGNRSFDDRVPEEINRRMVDHISDVNMPYSEISRGYLLREGIAPDRVVKTGSPMREIIDHYAEKIAASGVLQRLDLTPDGYFVVSAHREENVDSERRFADFCSALNRLAADFGKRVVVSTHPRTRKRIDEVGIDFHPGIEFMKPLAFTDYVHLQQHAFVVLSDSGTISEEASILGLKALNIRESHERPEGVEEGAAILTGMTYDTIRTAIEVVRSAADQDIRLPTVRDYDVPNVSEKVVRTIVGYRDLVMRNVWRVQT